MAQKSKNPSGLVSPKLMAHTGAVSRGFKHKANEAVTNIAILLLVLATCGMGLWLILTGLLEAIPCASCQ